MMPAHAAPSRATTAGTLDDPSSVRWLAQRVLDGTRAAVAGGVPAPHIMSVHVSRSQAARDYALWWVRHAERGGTFAARTRGLRLLPGSIVLRLLFALRYDGLVYEQDGRIAGHVFFQRHGASLHGFSTAVDGDPAHAGWSTVMMLDYVAYASAQPGISRVRIGRGHNNTTRRLLERVHAHSAALGWRVDDDGWITFQR